MVTTVGPIGQQANTKLALSAMSLRSMSLMPRAKNMMPPTLFTTILIAPTSSFTSPTLAMA